MPREITPPMTLLPLPRTGGMGCAAVVRRRGDAVELLVPAVHWRALGWMLGGLAGLAASMGGVAWGVARLSGDGLGRWPLALLVLTTLMLAVFVVVHCSLQRAGAAYWPRLRVDSARAAISSPGGEWSVPRSGVLGVQIVYGTVQMPPYARARQGVCQCLLVYRREDGSPARRLVMCAWPGKRGARRLAAAGVHVWVHGSVFLGPQTVWPERSMALDDPRLTEPLDAGLPGTVTA